MVRSQRKWNVAFSTFMIMLFLFLLQINFRIALLFALGTGVGFALQKSRFCFVAALRDPIVIGITELSRAVILLVGLSILGFAVVYQIAQRSHQFIELNVFPLGMATILGGVLFGIGMVLAGGCVSGMLMRIGEGFAMQMVAFAGILIGALAGGNTQFFWKTVFGEWPGIFLPAWLGWIPTLLLEFLVLIGLWRFARWWQKKQVGG